MQYSGNTTVATNAAPTYMQHHASHANSQASTMANNSTSSQFGQPVPVPSSTGGSMYPNGSMVVGPSSGLQNGSADRTAHESLVQELRALFGPRCDDKHTEMLRAQPIERLMDLRDQARAKLSQSLGNPGANSAAGHANAPIGNARSPTTPQLQAVVRLIQEFAAARGLPFDPQPQVEGHPINLGKLFVCVTSRGGSATVTQHDGWSIILAAMQFPADRSSAQPGSPPSYNEAHKSALAQLYSTYLGPYERFVQQQQAKSKGQLPVTGTVSNALSPASAKGKAVATEPEPAPEPKKYKRQKVEYDPITRAVDSAGGWSVEAIDATLVNVHAQRRHRAIADLGMVDLYSLLMSLRSRIPSEIVYALNVLKLLVDAPLTSNWRFRIRDGEDLLDELVELFEETAFASAGDSPPLGASTKRRQVPHAGMTSYATHARATAEAERQLRSNIRNVGRARAALARSDLLLALMSLFRGLASTAENSRDVILHPRLISLVLRASVLGEQVGDDMAWLSVPDLLTVRKDALHLLCDLGMGFSLTTPTSAASALALIRFFLCDEYGSAVLTAQYGVVALVMLARVFVLDSNRDMLSRAHVRPVELFEQLVRTLPLVDTELHIAVGDPHSLMVLQMTALALFNLAFVASPSQRSRLRGSAGVATALLRVIRRLMFLASRDPTRRPIIDEIWGRLVAVLRLLDDDPHLGTGGESADSHGPWFGARRGAGEEQGENGEDDKDAEKDEVDTLPPPLFASRGNIEFIQFAAMGLEPYMHDMLLGLYERQPIKSKS